MGVSAKIVVSIVVLMGSLGFLLVDTMKDPEVLTYFHAADEVLAKPSHFLGKRIRMGGHVEKGSILQRPGTLEYRFEVRPIPGMLKHPEVKDQTVRVAYTGVVPDTFKDDAEVIVAGVLADDGRFAADELVAKCPSKYEAEAKSKGTY